MSAGSQADRVVGLRIPSKSNSIAREVARRERDRVAGLVVRPTHVLEQRLRLSVDMPNSEWCSVSIGGTAAGVIDRDRHGLLKEEGSQVVGLDLDLHVLRCGDRER